MPPAAQLFQMPTHRGPIALRRIDLDAPGGDEQVVRRGAGDALRLAAHRGERRQHKRQNPGAHLS